MSRQSANGAGEECPHLGLRVQLGLSQRRRKGWGGSKARVGGLVAGRATGQKWFGEVGGDAGCGNGACEFDRGCRRCHCTGLGFRRIGAEFVIARRWWHRLDLMYHSTRLPRRVHSSCRCLVSISMNLKWISAAGVGNHMRDCFARYLPLVRRFVRSAVSHSDCIDAGCYSRVVVSKDASRAKLRRVRVSAG